MSIQIDLPRIFIGDYQIDNNSPEELVTKIVRPEFNDAMQRLEESQNRIAPIVIPYSASVVVDLNKAIAQWSTFIIEPMTANITSISILRASTGQKWTIIFSQDNIGGYTVSGWPASVRLQGAAFVATTTAMRVSTLTFEYNGVVHIELGRTLDV